MYAHIQLLSGYQQPLWYSIPDSLTLDVHQGSLVRVPLRRKRMIGLVTQISATIPGAFAIRSIESVEKIPHDRLFDTFLSQVCSYYQLEKKHLYKRLRHFLKTKSRTAVDTLINSKENDWIQSYTLTDEQRHATDVVCTALDNNTFAPHLLFGVTGSGKTEVYKKIIEHAITQGKSILLVLPEISLALHFAERIGQTLTHIPIFSFHAATSTKEKKQLWRALLDQQPLVIIGVHMPLLLPIANLGVIIIDEEHDSNYQEKKHPALNTKEIALMRAQLYKIPIVLGSATPAISTLYVAKTRNWPILYLTKRYQGKFADIKIVSLAQSYKRRHFWISKELEVAIAKQLARKKQTLLFLNRRGFALFMQCSHCGLVFTCTQCSVSLTMHEQGMLICHYCGINQPLPNSCSSCNAPEKALIKKGIGTQQLVKIIQEIFPKARIARADLDTNTSREIWQETMRNMENQEIDILIGTQTITKGLDLRHVTLVGVIWADMQLHMPWYNATESTIQQLIQVAGRAGRHDPESSVIIQTVKEQEVFAYIDENKYHTFYEYELTQRQSLQYPPIARLARIDITHENHDITQQESRHIATILRSIALSGTIILGPALPPVYRIKHVVRYTLFLKSPSMQELVRLWKSIDHKDFKSHIMYTPNPLR